MTGLTEQRDHRAQRRARALPRCSIASSRSRSRTPAPSTPPSTSSTITASPSTSTTRGWTARIWERIGRGPGAVGVLGRIPAHGTLVVDEVTEHPAFEGFPPATRRSAPSSVPRSGSGTTSSATSTSRARRAASPRRTSPSSRRSPPPRPSPSTTRSSTRAPSSASAGSPRLRRSPPPCSPTRATRRRLARIVETAQELARASAATLVLPGVDDEWVLEFTAGHRAGDLLGLSLPGGRSGAQDHPRRRRHHRP